MKAKQVEEATKAKRVQQEINEANVELQRYAEEAADKLEREQKTIKEVEAREQQLQMRKEEVV